MCVGAGVISYAMTDLFKLVQEEHERTGDSIDVTISYLEVYNETIRDLLAPRSKKDLPLRACSSCGADGGEAWARVVGAPARASAAWTSALFSWVGHATPL